MKIPFLAPGEIERLQERWARWRANMTRRFQLFLLVSTLLGICLVLVLTPARPRTEAAKPFSLAVGTALVMGSVQNRQGQPLVGAEVDALTTNGDRQIAETLTQDDGLYVLTLPADLPEQFVVEIQHDHFKKATIDLSASDREKLKTGQPIVLHPTILGRKLGPAFWAATSIFAGVLILMATGTHHNTLAALMGMASVFLRKLFGWLLAPGSFHF